MAEFLPQSVEKGCYHRASLGPKSMMPVYATPLILGGLGFGELHKGRPSILVCSNKKLPLPVCPQSVLL